MNLESLKYHLIEKIVATKDETTLKKVAQIFTENNTTTTVIQKTATPQKENGIVQRRSIYRISDRPTVIATKAATTKVVEPVRVIQTKNDTDSSLSKLQRLVRQRALSNHPSDV